MKRFLSLTLCVALLVAAPFAMAQEPVKVVELLRDNTELDLSEYEGKAIYLNFFTEWCYYCMQEMPDIVTLRETYDPDELAIVLIHVWDGEDEQATQSVKEQFGMEDFTFYEDSDFAVSRFVGLRGYPASMFINKSGELLAGYNQYMSLDQMQVMMDALDVALRPEEDKSV